MDGQWADLCGSSLVLYGFAQKKVYYYNPTQKKSIDNKIINLE